MLWEGMGFGWTEVCYSGVTFPLVAPGLEHAVKLGYRRIIVFPYFLFTGVLVKRIYRIADEMAARHPEIEFLKARYLNDHPLVLDAFAERVDEILAGGNAMNCQHCLYRTKVLGFEAMVGMPQQSHHHHVEGIGTDADKQAANGHQDHHGHDHHHDHDHDHEHHHGDGHHHHHPPHPHGDHPLGPGRRNPDAVE
jgi:sirohydrochlorin cobaltochelatase